MAKLEILNPVAHFSASRSPLATRLATLENKRIGLYWNGHVGGDVALTRASQLLESKVGGMEFKLIRTGNPGSRECKDEAKSMDGVIAAIGD